MYASQKLHTRAGPKLDGVVTCLPGLEPLLSSELTALEIPHQNVKHGAELIDPDIGDILKSNLYLGTASNVLLRCSKPFSSRGLPELRRKVARLPWQEILKDQVRLKARVSTSKSKLYHSTAIEGRVIAGVYEALGYDIPADRVALEYPPEIEEDAPTVRLDVQIVRDQVEIFLYTAATPIHRRGYRLQTGKAPLREDLAYAMLYSAGWLPAWHMAAQDRPYEHLFDPMCGSGTIAIEAASMAAGLPPGRLRPPPLAGTTFENNDLYTEMLDDQTRQHDWTTRPVSASDRDSGAIEATRSNAERAGVLDMMDIQAGAVSVHSIWNDSSSSFASLLVATNPPFGRRVSPNKKPQSALSSRQGDRKLMPLYQTLQKLTAERKQTDVVLLTHKTELLRRAGWTFKEAFTSSHGGMKVTFIHSGEKHEPMTTI